MTATLLGLLLSGVRACRNFPVLFGSIGRRGVIAARTTVAHKALRKLPVHRHVHVDNFQRRWTVVTPGGHRRGRPRPWSGTPGCPSSLASSQCSCGLVRLTRRIARITILEIVTKQPLPEPLPRKRDPSRCIPTEDLRRWRTCATHRKIGQRGVPTPERKAPFTFC